MSGNKKRKPTVTIVVNAHNENLLLYRTLKSLDTNIVRAQTKGIVTEVIIVADKVDEPTRNFLENKVDTALTAVIPKIDFVEYGDLGLSRNHGIRLAEGEFVGNFDGDDLWSDNWISEAVTFLQEHDRVVAHHAAVLNFGTKNGVWHIRSSTDPSFNPHSVVEDNWWPSCMMTRREIALEIPYRQTLRNRQFSFEDWLWNCETLAAGLEHMPVPGTVFFYRRKEMSMLVQHITGLVSQNKLFTPSGLEAYMKMRRIDSVKYDKQNSFSMKGAILPATRWTKSKTRHIAIKSVKVSGKIAIKVGKRYGKKFLDSHHRIKTFATTVHGAAIDLVTPLQQVDGQMLYSGPIIPAWLKEQWTKANDIEPHLYPTHHNLKTAYNRPMMTMGSEQAAYWDMAQKIGENTDYIMIVPYVRRAGAYMVAMHYVRAYKQFHPKSRVVVLSTESTYDSELDMIPEGVEFVQASPIFCAAEKAVQEKVLAKLFVNLMPKHIHVVHSQEGFRTFARYGSQISLKSKLYFSTFNYDYTADGQKMNAFVAYAEPALPYLTKVFTDNEWIVDDTVRIYGIDRSLMSAHAMPVVLPEEKAKGVNLRKTDGKMRVLWAARMAKQKRPDILLAIAKAAHEQNLPYEFVVYGEIYDKIVSDKLLEQLCDLPNVQYKGAFHKGITALPTKAFEVYMSTSEAEGTPNAILEAQAAGLLVLAPKIGGIPEVVSDGKTGMLVNTFDEVDEYLAKLKVIYDDQATSKKIGQAGKKEVQTKRSWDAFVKQVSVDLD